MPKKAPIRWARRVEQHKIRQLYARDAQGIVDEELIDEVGYAMYARCESIAVVTAASVGRAKCHACGEIIRHRGVKDEAMVCVCGWETTWGTYLTSYQRKQLHGGSAFPAFEKFLERWPQVRGPRDKLLEIDRLIHELHLNAEIVRFARPAAVNVIEGTMTDVIALLNELAYGDLSTPGMGEARDGLERAAGRRSAGNERAPAGARRAVGSWTGEHSGSLAEGPDAGGSEPRARQPSGRPK